jgi:hypothetical protein
VFSANHRLVQIESQGFHLYCQTDSIKYLELQKAPKNLEDFAILFVRRQDFTDNMEGAYQNFATSPVADPAWMAMMRQHISEPTFAYKRRQAMKAFCNVWGSVKANRPSVNKYVNLTRHSSSLLDLNSDIGCPLLGLSLSA